MKYIITAKGGLDVNSGNGSYSGGTPIKQTESATELIINRLALISYLKEGMIDKDTIVVTLSDRKFLYENMFQNIEIYNPEKEYEDCIDLVTDSMLDTLCNSLPYKPFYGNFERDKKEIFNISYNDEILKREIPDFLMCIPRLKNSDTRRNIDQKYWSDFLNIAKSKYEKIFVFGKGNENLEDDQITYVDTFKDYCSYLHHYNCVDIVSTISGPCHYAQFFSNTNSKTKLTMIDNLDLFTKHGNDPSYFHPCLNFTKIEVRFVKSIVSPDELLLSLN
jgi:hypothetical protein